MGLRDEVDYGARRRVQIMTERVLVLNVDNLSPITILMEGISP